MTVLDRNEEEVRRDGSGSSPSARSDDASRSRSSITGVTSGGEASAAIASAAARLDTGAGAWRAFELGG